MKALIVGAGAVGRVLGSHLAAAGWSVGLLVRPGRRDAALGPLWCYPLNRRRRWQSAVAFRPSEVLDEVAQAAERHWDAVILAVPSPALRRGDWLARLVDAAGGSTWLALQPGAQARADVGRLVPSEQTVWMAFGLMAVAVPLPGQLLRRAGIAYWWPPGGGVQLAGPDSRAARLAAAFQGGGLPAHVTADVAPSIAFGSAVLDSLAAGLECAGWSFDRLSTDRQLLALTCRAARQAAAAAARRLDVSAPAWLALLRPTTVSWGLRAANRLLPLPFEAHLEAHFGKLGEQTRLSLAAVVASAGPSATRDAVQALLDRLERGQSPLEPTRGRRSLQAGTRPEPRARRIGAPTSGRL